MKEGKDDLDKTIERLRIGLRVQEQSAGEFYMSFPSRMHVYSPCRQVQKESELQSYVPGTPGPAIRLADFHSMAGV